jgi:hypothetical protein
MLFYFWIAKKKKFLALNFRLAVNMLQIIYDLKKHILTVTPSQRIMNEIDYDR